LQLSRKKEKQQNKIPCNKQQAPFQGPQKTINFGAILLVLISFPTQGQASCSLPTFQGNVILLLLTPTLFVNNLTLIVACPSCIIWWGAALGNWWSNMQ
jgi:hypothetical protein